MYSISNHTVLLWINYGDILVFCIHILFTSSFKVRTILMIESLLCDIHNDRKMITTIIMGYLVL